MKKAVKKKSHLNVNSTMMMMMMKKTTMIVSQKHRLWILVKILWQKRKRLVVRNLAMLRLHLKTRMPVTRNLLFQNSVMRKKTVTSRTRIIRSLSLIHTGCSSMKWSHVMIRWLMSTNL
ncbi:hypothetical protein VPH35_032993 [Triticum aestivum]